MGDKSIVRNPCVVVRRTAYLHHAKRQSFGYAGLDFESDGKLSGIIHRHARSSAARNAVEYLSVHPMRRIQCAVFQAKKASV